MDHYVYTVGLLLIIFLLIYIYCKNCQKYFEKLGIPYVGGWPLLGTMTDQVLQRRHMSEIMQELYDLSPEAKYVGAYNFTRPVFCINDPELIKSTCIKNFDNFPDHIPIGHEEGDPLFGQSVFNLPGQRWRDARASVTPSFTASKMKMMFGLMLDCAKGFVSYLDEQPKEKLRMMNSGDLLIRYVSNCVSTCVFGVEVDSLRDRNNELFVEGRRACTLGPKLVVKMMVFRIFPGIVKALKISLFGKKLEAFFTNLISRTVRMRDEKGIYRPDILQVMMDSRFNSDNKKNKMDLATMTSQAFVFLFAGFDPVSLNLSVLAHELAQNPHAQKKLQEEIDQVMKETNGEPDYDAIQGMKYLQATFYETIRMHAQTSFLDRICREDFELPPALPGLEPVLLKPGALIWIPLSAIHRDPRYHEDPHTFKPERFYGKTITTNDPINLGFGIGPRSCIGKRFGLMVTKILLVHLLAKYTLVANKRTALRYNKNTTAIRAEGGFWLDFERREITA